MISVRRSIIFSSIGGGGGGAGAGVVSFSIIYVVRARSDSMLELREQTEGERGTTVHTLLFDWSWRWRSRKSCWLRIEFFAQLDHFIDMILS